RGGGASDRRLGGMALELRSEAVAAARTRPTAPAPSGFGRAPRLSVGDRRFFTERLALLLETGTPLHVGLQTLARQTRGPRFRAVVQKLHDDVSGGMPFAQALARQGDDFPTTYATLVAAAEQGGFLDQVLRHLADIDERNARLRTTILSSLFYPAFLLVFSVVVVVFVLTSVFPRFETMFAGIHDRLPITTVVLMAASDLLRHHWVEIVGALAALAAIGGKLVASERGGEAVDRAVLALPVLRDLFAQFYLSRVLRVLSLSLQHGVALFDALRSCQGLVRNRVFARFLSGLAQDVEEGRGITPAFERAPFVPDMVRQMVATGEQSARLALVMQRIADFYEQEFTRRLGTLSKLIEPVMLLVMGAVVGVLVSSLILPIFKLSSVAH
ncbi:MAG: type II secretion system F family protein, partial [Planctomycetes bacterium]|nr:type II secretion system F family protein [Planctomycetota bacterium]